MKYLLLLLFSLPAFSTEFLPSHFTMDYEETIVSSLSGQAQKFKGKFSYSYPNKFRLDVISPDPSHIVSDGKTNWKYTAPFIEGEQGEVEIQKASALPLTKFLLNLKKGLVNNPAFSVMYNNNQLVLKLMPMWKKDLGIDQVILLTKTENAKEAKTLADVSELSLDYSNNRKMKWIISRFEAMKSFEPSYFEFKIPANTKVIDSK